MSSTELSIRGASLDRLNDRQRRFVAEYLITLNGADAARRAGYKHPNVAAAKLLKNRSIAAVIGKTQREDLERLDLDRDALLRELAYLALRDPIDLCDADGMIRVDDLRRLPPRIRKCIDGIKVKQETDRDGNVTGQTIELKLAPKTPAVELAMKHFGMIGPDMNVEQKVMVNWDPLYHDHSNDPDPLEERIENGTLLPPEPDSPDGR